MPYNRFLINKETPLPAQGAYKALPQVKTFDSTNMPALQTEINSWFIAILALLPDDTHMTVQSIQYQQPKKNALSAMVSYTLFDKQ